MGKHRKITASQTAKGRFAFVAIAAGAVSGAGVGGAAVAQVNTEPPSADVALANDSEPISSSQEAPQVLSLAEYKPVNGLNDQLNKAVTAAKERADADLAARLPSVVKPTEGTLTSGFGMRWGSLHPGVDIANAIGTPILAVMDGTVINSGPASGYGQWIRIQHDDGSISVYGHMDTLDVSVGEHVTAGQKIAGMGNQGFSTGPHLHFEIHPGGAGAVDPLPWFSEHGITV